MQLGGAAAVPLKRLGQEDGFAQWLLRPQLKHCLLVEADVHERTACEKKQKG